MKNLYVEAEYRPHLLDDRDRDDTSIDELRRDVDHMMGIAVGTDVFEWSLPTPPEPEPYTPQPPTPFYFPPKRHRIEGDWSAIDAAVKEYNDALRAAGIEP